jgi:hypothetical protein
LLPLRQWAAPTAVPPLCGGPVTMPPSRIRSQHTAWCRAGRAGQARAWLDGQAPPSRSVVQSRSSWPPRHAWTTWRASALMRGRVVFLAL